LAWERREIIVATAPPPSHSPFLPLAPPFPPPLTLPVSPPALPPFAPSRVGYNPSSAMGYEPARGFATRAKEQEAESSQRTFTWLTPKKPTRRLARPSANMLAGGGEGSRNTRTDIPRKPSGR
jgi:hypothetical protein